MSHLNGTAISGSSVIDQGEVSFTPASAGALVLGNCYSYSTENSVLVGVANNDAITAQNGEVCAPQLVIDPPASLQVTEGQVLTLEFLAASGINLNSVTDGKVQLNAREQDFNWYYTYWSRNRRVTIPAYSLDAVPEISDGGFVSLTLSGLLNGAALHIGNDLNLQVFIPDADFDNDGLSNAIEVQYAGLDPTNDDSDADGILDAADDLDHDGLINSDEIANNTLLDDGDTDNDNLSDGNEVNVYNSNPNLYDTDGDGLSDGSEVNSTPSSDPTLRDTDADGIDDNIEVQYGLDPGNANDAAADADNDGLTNLEEVANNTRIDLADTDGDTLSDGDEVNGLPATNPLDRDTDDDGLEDNEDYAPVVPDTEAPVVSLTAPDLGLSYLKGQRVTFELAASDLGRVTQVFYRINNIQQPTVLTAAPYQFSIVLPTDAESIVFEALAVDTNGNQGSTGALTVNVIDDPLTTVVGTVVDINSLPAAGVTLSVHNIEAISQADGSFVITGVPVAPGDITVLANVVIDGVTLIGGSSTVSPVQAGVTDVGQIQLIQDKITVGYFNNRYGTGREYQRLIIERAGMEATQITNLNTFDLSTIDMLMVDNNNYYLCTSGQYYPNRQRIFDWVAAGGTLIFHEDRYYSSFCSGYNNLLPKVPGTYSANYSGSYIYPWSTANEFASGPGGDFTGFNQSPQVYGSVALDSLIAEATPLVYNSSPYQGYVVGLDYPWQQGRVYYSTVRLESTSTISLTHTQYAPNMLNAMFTRSLPDTDTDGLPDRLEIVNGTNITLADTDGDGMNDAYEVRYGFDPLVDDASGVLDPDADGADNLLESQHGSNPGKFDSDQDGLSDGDEILYVLPSDPTMKDTDLDRLHDNVERSYGTDPANRDTDADTIDDGVEVYSYNSNPLLLDSDGDGIGDALEISNGLNPSYGGDAYSDNDGDGLSNRDELLVYGTDYNNADGDNDGLNDGDELAAGSDPFNPDSDNDGILDGNDTEILVADITPPVIQLTSHATTVDAVTGETINFLLDVSDNGQLASVSMSETADGTPLASITQAPYQLAFNVDGANSAYTLYFTAADVSGNSTTLGPVTISLIAEPFAQVTGIVVDELGRPIQGAEIGYAGSTPEYTDITGQFTLTAVPTVINPLPITFSAMFGNQEVNASIDVALVRSGITDVGTVVLSMISGSSSTVTDKIVGYYQLQSNTGSSAQVASIITAGLTAVNVGDMNTADLTQFDILYVQAGSSGNFPSNYVNNVSKINEFVENGGVLVFHDYVTTDAAAHLPGNPGTFVYNENYDTQVITTDETFTNGPGGVIDNTTLDFGNHSSYGYYDASTVPSGAVGLLSNVNVNHWVAFAYPYGSGNVIYSSIPLAYYLNGSSSAAFRDIYAPNILAYASTLLKVDTDLDGLDDYDEVIIGTDYQNPDSDGDGLLDGFEVSYGFDPLIAGEQSLDPDTDGLTNIEEQQYGTDPFAGDTDGDGLSDSDEVNTYQSDPVSADGDADGISDADEISFGTDALSSDTDADGLNDYEELFTHNSDPLNPDSDGDGMSDGFEIQYGMQNQDATADNDGDGLSNAQESDAGSSPFSSDSDNDRLSDYAEYIIYGTDPFNADTDSAGRRDAEEILLDTTSATIDDDLTNVTDTYYYLQNENGNTWQIRDRYGYIYDGTVFSNSFRLYVNNSSYTADYYNAYQAIDPSGQELFFNIRNMGDLLVGRRVYVPTDGAGFIRYLEVLHNPGSAPITAIVRNDSYYYSGNPDVITQSGGSQLSADDQYLIISDLNNISQPVVSHLFAGPNAETGILNSSSAADANQSWSIGQQIDIPAGETRYILHYAGQYINAVTAEAGIQDLRKLGGNALKGLTEDIRNRVVNFSAHPDADFDGLTDAEEAALGTLADNSDTDGDGVNDNIEVQLGTDPLVNGDQQLTTVTGRVINTLGVGIGNVTVVLDGGYQALTDVNGNYSIADVVIDRLMLGITATLDVNGVMVTASLNDISPNLSGATQLQDIVLSYQSTAGAADEMTAENSGTQIYLSDDSFQQVAFTDGFTFNFFGVSYSGVYISSNGSLTFGNGSTSLSPSVPGDLVQNLPRISPLLGDLNPSSGGAVYYSQTPSSFTATWLNVREFSSTSAHTFRVTLFTNGTYVIQYGDVDTTSGRTFGVATTPGGAAVYEAVDWSESAGLLPAGPAIYELFAGMAGFDLENQLIVFKPESGSHRIYRNLCDDTDQDGLCDIEESLIGTVVGNQDTDGDGIPDGSDLNPLVADGEVPAISLLSPSTGQSVVRTSTLPVDVHVVDAGGLAEVSIVVDATEFVHSYTGVKDVQISETYTVPLTADSVTLTVTATDLSGNISTSGPHVYAAIDDPGTTVTGRAHYDYNGIASPIPGFNVTISLTGSADTYTAITDSNGEFAVSGIPTILGDVRAQVNGVITGYSQTIYSNFTTAAAGDITDLGDHVFNHYRWSYDNDNDGLLNIQEQHAGTDPYNSDTDADGLGDAFEVQYGFDPLVDSPDAYALDTDSDGLSNQQEIDAGTDPGLADSDSDGLGDFQEVFVTITDPVDQDTDNDGLLDDFEITLGTDPKNNDSDFDGINDRQELDNSLDPLSSDSDGDGMPDGYEYSYGLISSLPEDDNDGDGLSNLAEFLVDTRPDQADTDYDGLYDGSEVLLHASNPTDDDVDGDGLDDPTELFVLETDPVVVDKLFSNSVGEDIVIRSGDVYGFGTTHWTVASNGYLNDITSTTGYYLGYVGQLYVDNSRYSPNYQSLHLSGNDDVYLGADAWNDTTVAYQRYYAGDNFVRILHIVENSSAEAVQKEIAIRSDYNAVDRDVRVLTSDGNEILESGDNYIIVGNPFATASNQGYIVHVLSAVNAANGVTDNSYGYNGSDQWQSAYTVDIPANGKRIIMQLVAAADTLEAAQLLAEELLSDSARTWYGISDADSALVVNMQPVTSVTASLDLYVPVSTSYEEGRSITITAGSTLVDAVDFYVNDVNVYTSTSEPHVYVFDLPRIANAGTTLTLQAKGSAAGVEQLSTIQQITLTERTKANITGRVLLDSSGVTTPVEAAVVTIDKQSYSVLTDVNGDFTLFSVFVDEPLDIGIRVENRNESIVWQEISPPVAVAGIVDIGDIAFRDDDLATLFDESTGNELIFTAGNNQQNYALATGMTYRGIPLDYMRIDKASTNVYLYDSHGNQVQYISLLPVYNLLYQRLGGIRIAERADYVAITFDSGYINGVTDSGMIAQVQIRSNGDIKYLYGSTLTDLGGSFSGYLDYEWRGNYSGSYVSASPDFSSLSVGAEYVAKPYKQLRLNEYFYSAAPFDLMGSVVEFDYDLINDFRVWSEPLNVIPIPLQYTGAGTPVGGDQPPCCLE
jgi:hypothetical protein